MGFRQAFLGLIALLASNLARVPSLLESLAAAWQRYFNPFKDLTGSNLSAISFLLLLSNGGWFGLGLGNSTENWLFPQEVINRLCILNSNKS